MREEGSLAAARYPSPAFMPGSLTENLMSFKAGIEKAFTKLMEKHPLIKRDILICKFGVYESLEWDSAAAEVAKEMLDSGYDIDGNMRCYIE